MWPIHLGIPLDAFLHNLRRDITKLVMRSIGIPPAVSPMALLTLTDTPSRFQAPEFHHGTPRRALGGGISKVNLCWCFWPKVDNYRTNGSKNDQTAPRTTTEYPTQGPGVVTESGRACVVRTRESF
jgi:hypothetical protein